MSYDRLASVTFHQLRIFAAVATRQSFARAAESLDLSPGTVSDQVRLLEAVVGVRLLDRSRGRRGNRLTEAGRVLLDTYQAYAHALERADAAIQALRESQAGTVAFGADVPFAGYVLPRLLDAFRAYHPSIRVRIEVSRRQDLVRALVRHHLDLAVVVGPVDDPTLTSEPLGAFAIVLVGPPGHRLAGRRTAPFAELVEEPLVLPSHPCVLRQRFEQLATEARCMVGPVVEVGDLDTRKQAILTGLGVGPLSYPGAAASLAAGDLVELRVEGFPMHFEWMLTQPRGVSRPEVQAFKAFLLDRYPPAAARAPRRGQLVAARLR